MSTFLDIQLASHNDRPADRIMVNVDHIVRIHPAYPPGTSTLVMDDGTSLQVDAGYLDIQTKLRATNGRIVVKVV